MSMAEEEEKTTSMKDDERLRLLLEEAGLESVPIDPVSLEALREWMATSADEFDVDVRVNVNTRMDYGVERKDTQNSRNNQPQQYAPPAPFVPMEGASPVENKILEQLHRQTQLLVNMQSRIDDLTATVDHLTTGSGGNSGFAHSQPTTFGTGIPSRATFTHGHGRIPTHHPRVIANWNNHLAANRTAPTPTATTSNKTPQQPTRAVQDAAARAVQDAAAAEAAAGNGGLLMAIRHSRIFQIMALFLALRRRHVQELDGGLIFKILFMMAILTARMSGSKKYGDPEWHVKFGCLVTLVVFGFLAQTGYIKYWYTFCVKERYPARIWNGPETVDDILNNANNVNHADAQARARAGGGPNPAAPRNNAPPNGNAPPGAAAAAPGGAWRNTFLGGMIPEANQGGALGAVQDVALLLGSFLMSIFPMWHPEGPPPRRAAPAQPPQEPLVQPNDGMAAPGAVQPPRDAFQAADDDDDEEDEDRDDRQDNQQ